MSGRLALAFQSPDQLQEVRAMAHRELDQWLDRMRPLLEQSKPPTLLELSRHFSETRGELLGGVLQSLSETLYAELLDQKQCHCPTCARRLNRKRVDRKRCNTLQGPATLERPSFYCPDCTSAPPSC